MDDTTATTITNPNNDGRRNSRRRKGIIGLVSAGLAALMLVGAGFAYFSDSITGSAAGTAGTLDLNGNLAVTHTNGLTTDTFVSSDVTNNTVPNINPGDVVKLSGTISNDGNKSAWIRTDITGSGDSSIAPYLYVYSGEQVPTQQQLLAAGSDPTSLPGYLGTVQDLSGTADNSATQIISGTGANAEADGNTATDGQYAANVEVYFLASAPNAAQNQNFSLNADVQAVQYRNNNTGTTGNSAPTDAQWNSVDHGTVSTGTWSSN